MTPWLRGLWVCASFAAGCVWPSPERQLLIDFFQACRVYDTTVLARLATVSCNPSTDGVVQDFEIVSIAERETGVLPPPREVTIRARVRTFEGALSDQTISVGLERRDGQWMVTSLTLSRASQTSPAASSAPPR